MIRPIWKWLVNPRKHNEFFSSYWKGWTQFESWTERDYALSPDLYTQEYGG